MTRTNYDPDLNVDVVNIQEAMALMYAHEDRIGIE